MANEARDGNEQDEKQDREEAANAKVDFKKLRSEIRNFRDNFTMNIGLPFIILIIANTFLFAKTFICKTVCTICTTLWDLMALILHQ